MPKYYEFKVAGYYLYFTSFCVVECMHVHASDKKLTEAGSAKFFVKGNGDSVLQNKGILTDREISNIQAFIKEAAAPKVFWNCRFCLFKVQTVCREEYFLFMYFPMPSKPGYINFSLTPHKSNAFSNPFFRAAGIDTEHTKPFSALLTIPVDIYSIPRIFAVTGL